MHQNKEHLIHLHLTNQLSKFKKGIYPLYIAHTIKGFVASLIGFFIPIYLLKIGFTLLEILGFFAIKYYFMSIFVILAGAIGNKVGLKHTMIVSLPLYLVYLISIMLLEKHPSLLILYSLAIFSAFIASIYWIPLHSLFARLSSNKNGASQVSALLSLRSFAGIIAPLLGGIISAFFGFETLFLIAILILIIPIIILLNSRDVHPHLSFSLGDLAIFFKKHTRLFLIIMLDSFGTFSEEILWPLFVFLILANTISVGIVGSLVGLGTIIFTIVIGKIVAKHNYLLIIKISAFMLAISWSIKMFANEKIFIYIISLLAAMFAIMFSIPLANHIYQTAKKDKNLDEFIIFKQILVSLSRFLAVILTLFIISKLNLSFLFTSLSYLLISIF